MSVDTRADQARRYHGESTAFDICLGLIAAGTALLWVLKDTGVMS